MTWDEFKVKFENFWEKLKREWKTAAVAVATAVVYLWDGVIATGFDFSQLVEDKYKAVFGLVSATLMLGLRKWTDPKDDDE